MFIQYRTTQRKNFAEDCGKLPVTPIIRIKKIYPVYHYVVQLKTYIFNSSNFKTFRHKFDMFKTYKEAGTKRLLGTKHLAFYLPAFSDISVQTETPPISE